MVGSMAELHSATQAAIDRLIPVLERSAPALLESLNQPVSERDLDALKRAIDPYPIPAEFETWLRFADGQHYDAGWWPVIDGPLTPAGEIVDLYTVGLEAQPPGLLPISYVNRAQVSIELAGPGTPALIDTSLESVEWRIVAPSIPALLDAVTGLARSGHLEGWPAFYAPDRDDPDQEAARGRYQASRDALAVATSELLRREDWAGTPFPQGKWFAVEEGPQYWGPVPQLDVGI